MIVILVTKVTISPELGSLMSHDSLELECESSEEDEGLDDTIKEVTEDLNDIMVEVERLKRSSGAWDNNDELQDMIKVRETYYPTKLKRSKLAGCWPAEQEELSDNVRGL